MSMEFANFPHLSAILLSCVVGRVVQQTFYGEKNERFAHLPDVSLGPGLPGMILVKLIVLFGLFPWFMLDVIQTSVIPFMGRLP